VQSRQLQEVGTPLLSMAELLFASKAIGMLLRVRITAHRAHRALSNLCALQWRSATSRRFSKRSWATGACETPRHQGTPLLAEMPHLAAEPVMRRMWWMRSLPLAHGGAGSQISVVHCPAASSSTLAQPRSIACTARQTGASASETMAGLLLLAVARRQRRSLVLCPHAQSPRTACCKVALVKTSCSGTSASEQVALQALVARQPWWK